MRRSWRLQPAFASVVAVVATAALLAGCGDASGASGDPLPRTTAADGAAQSRPHHHHKPRAEKATHFRFFSDHSFWNEPVERGAAVDPGSAGLVSHLAEEAFTEVGAKTGPFITTSPYGVPIYRVPASQPTVRVELHGGNPEPALQAAFDAVPLPPEAVPSAGSDGHLVLWQPHSDSLWEFFRLRLTRKGWRASWGGAMNDVAASPGVYNRRVWPGSEPWWGASASSLSIAGGLITFEDLEAGEINHALAISLPDVRGGAYASPARRSDGSSSDPLSLPEGAHLQLDPNFDLSKVPLPPLTRMIAKAAQKYGIFVRDGAGDVTFYAQDPVNKGVEPYAGPAGFYGGRTPIELLSQFPWHHLRVLRMKLHPTAR